MHARLHAQLALSPSGGPRDLAARPRFRYIHVPGPGGGEAGARAWSRRYRPATHSRAAQPPGGLPGRDPRQLLLETGLTILRRRGARGPADGRGAAGPAREPGPSGWARLTIRSLPVWTSLFRSARLIRSGPAHRPACSPARPTRAPSEAAAVEVRATSRVRLRAWESRFRLCN
jgi:hypothetical protein